jgi:hypothetical protein
MNRQRVLIARLFLPNLIVPDEEPAIQTDRERFTTEECIASGGALCVNVKVRFVRIARISNVPDNVTDRNVFADSYSDGASLHVAQ